MSESQELILGPSAASRDFAARLERLSSADVTVLIEGESGTGKGLVARSLHQASSRSAEPLVEVQLAALSPTLVESELFGHEEGAFTGARGARVGRFRRADGGTLLLDGVDTLPAEVQVKLLRALQERRIEPLGAESDVPIDTRVIATSTGVLAGEVEAGRFRSDLYYRLAVVVLEVPPLRTRLEDLPLLTEALLARGAQRAGVSPRRLTSEAAAVLAAHPWPGNVRELENALERVLVLPPVGEAGQPIAAEEFEFLSEATRGEVDRIAQRALALGLTLADFEQALLAAALREQRGVISAAARQVGLTRKAFDYRIEKGKEGSE